MLIHIRELENGQRLETDLWIIGAGAAGLTIAHELRDTPLRICVLESGGLEPETAKNDLQFGRNVGRAYAPLEQTRSRFFGGSTNCWAGFCRPLDPTDFEARDWIPHSGWPLTPADLGPFYARAHDVLGLGPYDYGAAIWTPHPGARIDLDGLGVQNGLFHFGQGPRRMGQVLRKELEAHPRIRVVLHADVTAIRLAANGRAVGEVEARNLAGRVVTVVTRRTVLSAGGIENPRGNRGNRLHFRFVR